jgi:hypothetical protein
VRGEAVRCALFLSLCFLCFLLFHSAALAQASATSISFQGVLNGTNGQPLANGSYTLGFQFWDHPTSTAASNRVGSAVTVPGVAVNGGVASTAIPMDSAWFNGQTRYLGVAVNGGSELTPRVLVTAVPYAVSAMRLAEGQDLFVNRLGVFTPPRPGSYVFLDARDPWGPPGMVGLELGLLIGTESRTVSASLNGGIYHGVLNLPQPEWIGHSFFKVGGTHHNGHVDPVPFNAGSISLEVASVGPGSRYSSALRFRTLADSYADNVASEKMAIMGNGTVIIHGTTRTTVLQITSAREAKQGFAPVDAAAILAKVAALPLSTWAYTNAPTVRHLGPVAQDFHAAFALGDDDQHIATVDADGVALAAIQGLNAKLEEQVRDKEAKIESLEKRVAELARLVGSLTARGQAASVQGGQP